MKVSQRVVDAIRAEYQPCDRRCSARALAEKYGPCKDYVWRIVTRRARKWRRG